MGRGVEEEVEALCRHDDPDPDPVAESKQEKD